MCLLIWVLCANNLPIVDKITSNYNKIDLLYGKITRRSVVGTEKKRNVGKFYLKKPGKLFIKYSNPEIIISIKNKALQVYYPEENKVVKMNYNELSTSEKHILGIDVLLEFNPLNGLEKIFYFERLDSTHLVALPRDGDKSGQAYDTKIGKIIFEFDRRKNIILQTKVFDMASKLISQTDYKDWTFTEGVWLPQDIQSKLYSDTKEIKENTRFHELFVNYAIDDKQFKFILPKNVKIVDAFK